MKLKVIRKKKKLPDGFCRTLLDGSFRTSEMESKVCKVETKCPRKWAFVDMEDGNIYIPSGTCDKNNQGNWLAAKASDLKCISKALRLARKELAVREMVQLMRTGSL